MSLRSCPHQKFPTKSKMCYCQVNWAQSVRACLAKSRLSFEKENIFEKLNFLIFWKCASVILSGQLGAVSAGHKEVFFSKNLSNPHSQLGEGLLLLVLKVSFRSANHYTFSSNLPQEISSSFSWPREKKEIRVSCSWHMFWRGASQSGDQMKVSEWVWVKNHPPDNCKSQKREFSPLQISTTTIDVILDKSWKGILCLGYSAHPRLIPKYFSWTRQEWRGTRLECNEHDQWR